jgi:hypothetical protein
MSIAEGFLRPLKVVCCVFSGIVLAGCSAPSSDRGEAHESQSAALSTTMIRTLGFESLSDWHVLSSTPTLALSTTRTEGNSSLSVKKGGWMQVESRLLSKEQAAPNSFGYSVRIPPGSTGWLGETQLSINAPSVGIYSQVVGTAALSGPGQFQRVQFTLSNALKAQLNNNYTDLQFRITVNVPSTATNAYLLDQLTFGNICESNPVIDDGNPCTDDSCDPLLGVRHLPRPNGSACSDGNACTQTDSCSAGTCVGSNPVACAPANRCHDAGECDSVTGACDYPLEEDPSTCREHLTVELPPAKGHRSFVIVANGALDVRDQVDVRAPIANVGSTWTHIGNDASLKDVYSKPTITVGDRSVLQGMLRKGAGHTLSSSASVADGISSMLFTPPSEHTISFDLPASGVLTDVAVEVEETFRIAPGPYGHVRLQPRARLELSSGDYFFESFDALEPDSALVLNERKGPVRIFLNEPFTFRSTVVSNAPPAELTMGVLGTGTVRFERPFEGTLIAPYADLELAPLNGAKHRGSFFAKNITVDAGVIVEPLPRDPNSCQKSEFRDAGSAACSGHGLEIVSHQGVTRALFEGEETIAFGKRVEPVEDFTFTFNQPVTLEKARSAVQILSTGCPESVLKVGCTHDVALEVTAVGTDGKTVRFSNENDPFFPGCQYELRIDDAPLTSGGACLAEPASLAFMSLSPENGSVLAYETSELRHDPQNRLVAALEFEETISWQADELFRERLAALGLRPGVDSFAPQGPVQQTDYASNAESIFYAQEVGGVPIAGYGYSVQRDRTTGRVLLVTGSVATGVTPPGAAVVTETAALATARAQVPAAQTTSPPARLELVPTHDGTGSFKLAYRFVLSDSQKFIRRYVDVDATSGAVLRSTEGLRQLCKSVDVTTLEAPDPLSSVMPVTLDTVQHQHGDIADPTTLYVTEYMRPNGPRAFTLDYRGGEPVSGVPLGRPSQFTLCPGQTYPNVVELPGDNGGPSWDAETYVAAQVHLAGESVLDYFANRPRPFGFGGAQWSGMDGQGLTQLETLLATPTPDWATAAYASRGHSEHPAILVDRQFTGGAMIDVIGHEFMHGIWDHLGYPYTAPEAKAVDEAVSDIFGSAAEYAVRQDEPSLWCLGPRDIETDCIRWLHAPGAKNQPYVYEGPNWCFGDACLAHVNMGVMNYWFYLLSRGGSAAGVQGCGGDVPPIDPDPKKAVDLATEILFVALRDRHYTPDGGFHVMANATIAASKQLHGDGPITDTVRAAWHAVKVWENYEDGDDPWLQPVRGESAVNPWKNLRWRLDVDAPLSDIQIDFSPTFDSSADAPNTPLISRTVPTEELNGDTVGTLSIALEPNQTFYWRVRPASSDPWGKCESIHWFTTGDLPGISSIDTGILQDVPPGTFTVKPEQITGAQQFKVQLSDRDTGCKADPLAEEQIIDADDPYDTAAAPRALFQNLQPDHEYYVNVQPIGPENADGVAELGACYAQLVRTLSLGAPKELKPEHGIHGINYFNEQPPFEWKSAPASLHHLVRVYSIDDNGACDYDALVVQTNVEELCQATYECATSVDIELPGVRDPMGYCWEVTSFSADGTESSTVSSRFHYSMPLTWGEPGVQLGAHEMRDPSPLPGDSYDQPVTLTWDEAPGPVLGYMVRVGNYPWPTTGPSVPENCVTKWCTYTPRIETVPPTLVTDTELELPGELASRGRYCWAAWPVLEDPEAPGQIWDRQPQAQRTLPFCYTSGPSEPVIKFSNPGSGDRIAFGETIKGTIEVGFIPDAQLGLVVSHLSNYSYDMSRCPTTGPYYGDVYDCVIEFSVTGIPEGETFEMTVTTYNSPVVNPQGPLPYDDLPPIHTVQKSIHVDPCGALGQACCPDQAHPCDDTQAAHCNSNGICASCGGLNQACCNVNGEWCNGTNLGCDAGTCRECGQDKVCCHSATNECPNGAVCVSENNTTRCRSCGSRGGPCCQTGNACDTQGDTCQMGVCASPCGPVAPVTITGPVNDYGEPHYADVNAAAQASCAFPELFGKLGNWPLTWEPPPAGFEPDYYVITYYPSGLQRTAPGNTTLYVPTEKPPSNLCGAIGVSVQAATQCGDLSAIEDESAILTMWQ